jgi:hypothetical protein
MGIMIKQRIRHHSDSHDRDSFYDRAIRTKLGDVPRAHYDPKEPLPETPAKALFELYERESVAASGIGSAGSRS